MSDSRSLKQNHWFLICVITFFGFSCKPDKDLNTDKKLILESSLGCLDTIGLTLNYLPYLTTVDKLQQAITIDEFHEFKIYLPDGITPATGMIENNYQLRTKRKIDGESHTYTLQKQNLQNEIFVNAPYLNTFSPSLCGDVWDSKHTRKTFYFNAQKDSTYTIYLYSGDSAGGWPYATISDSTGHVYFLDVPSATNFGTGCWGDPCSDSEIYTLQANVTGKIFLEFYGHQNPNPTYDNIALVRVWVKL